MCVVFRVDLFCSGKVDGEAVLTVQLNLTIHANNYTVLNFKRRKMCYKSKCPNGCYQQNSVASFIESLSEYHFLLFAGIITYGLTHLKMLSKYFCHTYP